MLGLDPGAAILVLALLAVDRFIMIWRWLLLLRASGAVVSARAASSVYLVSSFVGSFLPAGVGADTLRAFSLTRDVAPRSESIASVAVDRVIGMLSIVLLGTFGIVVWTRQVEGELQQTTLLLAMLVTLGVAAIFWADRILTVAVPPSWRDTPQGGRLMRLLDALGRYRGRGGTLMVVLLLSVAVQVLRVLQAYALGRGLGLVVPFAYYLVFMPIGLLMLLIPISISGLGLPQGVIVWLLRPQGVPDAPAFALSTLVILTGIIANLPGAWLYLRARR